MEKIYHHFDATDSTKIELEKLDRDYFFQELADDPEISKTRISMHYLLKNDTNRYGSLKDLLILILKNKNIKTVIFFERSWEQLHVSSNLKKDFPDMNFGIMRGRYGGQKVFEEFRDTDMQILLTMDDFLSGMKYPFATHYIHYSLPTTLYSHAQRNHKARLATDESFIHYFLTGHFLEKNWLSKVDEYEKNF
jgi:superfamily II DNA/RNA helicase